ncbi:putative P450 monooxygenase [Lepidopterella palustris CBS 459.81]|uniref:Putative P450 monooxygenase n=1 Tax=Lepidopterella palustris CBS 459.81 TaxID=1314670 RepID=A0A8E2EAB9_9PEZI|nr:putative P450 monooxygenase [Lepidopterella palustris CBS 459.81]
MNPLALAAVAVALLLLYVIRQIRVYNSLKEFRGPPTSAFSRLWLLHAIYSGKMNLHFNTVNEQHGDTARIGPRFLLTRDPALIRKMNAVRSPYTRAEWYNSLRLHPTRDNIVSFRDEAIHNKLRTQMSHGYSGKENLHMESDIDEHLLQMFGLIRQKYISTDAQYRPLNLSRIITFFTLDVISTIAFGKSFGFLVIDDDPFEYLKQLHVFLPAIMMFSVFPEVQKIMRLPLMRKLAPQATDVTGLGKIMGFAKDVVAERFGDNKVIRKDMLGSFLAHGLTQEQLESETITQITAGSDSTATAIRMTLFLITTNSSIYSKLLSELTIAQREGHLTRPILRDSESRTLPYLQACIKEGLRLYPPVTGLLAKEVPPQGDILDGRFVPGGTSIGWNSWGLMRLTEVFGQDVEIFRPERWLPGGGQNKEQIEYMNEVVGLVFGYGRFGCLGKPVAMVELNKSIAELLLRFTFQVANPAHPFDSTCIGFFLHENMIFRVSERQEPLDFHNLQYNLSTVATDHAGLAYSNGALEVEV